MADPLASWMWTRLTEPPQDVSHDLVVNMNFLDRSGPEAVEIKDVQPEAPVFGAKEGGVDAWEDDGDGHISWDEVNPDLLQVGKPTSEEGELPTIWRVHPSIRKQESEAYDPMLFSIGPLHHGDNRLLPMQKVKLRYVESLFHRGPKNSIRNYIRTIHKCEDRARKQYADDINLSKEKFVSILVIDGCFIIEYFLRRVLMQRQETINLFGVGWSFTHLRRDLMLLENQIPFFVLVKLFEMTNTYDSSTSYKGTFLDLALEFLHMKLIPDDKRPKEGEVHHLLHLQHKCLNPHGPRDHKHRSNGRQTASNRLSRLFYGLLYLVFIHELPPHTYIEESKRKETIPSATELHDSGVKFKRKVPRKDEVASFLDVSFTVEGTLEMPFFRVRQMTSSQLRNSIALEQCQSQLEDYFTTYAIFMCNIIKTESDVSTLRKYGIIEATLGNDKEVAKMFNSLLKGTLLTYKKDHINSSLLKDVNNYFDVPHHRWRAKVVSASFRSPWAPISVIAAVISFLISITQLAFTILRRSAN